jgi:pimeloyl-ACP methyl ester carboxylesterase
MIPYAISGSGPGLVLVHGTGADAKTTFSSITGEFTGRHTVILPDADLSEDPLTIEAIANQFASAIAGATAEPVDLLGFSQGAQVGAAIAALHPSLVRRLVLIGGWTHADPYISQMMSLWLRLSDDPDAFARFAMLTAFSPAYLNSLSPTEMAELATVRPTRGTLRQIELNLRADIRPLLPGIRAQTLVVGCAKDHTIPVSNARALHAAIPHSTYAELDCGHVAHIERPAEFLALIRSALCDPAAPDAFADQQ